MRTEQDIKNRKAATRRYYSLEKNKEQKRNYMKAYAKRDYVKARVHEYYIVNKMHWGEIKKKKNNWGGMRQENEDIKRLHEAWAQENGYRNENLHAKNSERFINYGELKEKTESEKLQDELEPIVNAPMMDKE